MLGRVTRQKVCQPGSAHGERGLLVGAAVAGHQRNELAGDEREGDEDRREHEPRQREDDADVMVLEPRAEPALRAEQEHEDQAGDDRRDREGQLDQGDQGRLAAEVELRDCPCRGEPENGVERDRDGGDDEGEPDRCSGRRGRTPRPARSATLCASASVSTAPSGSRSIRATYATAAAISSALAAGGSRRPVALMRQAFAAASAAAG